jgi:hypothetical protein
MKFGKCKVSTRIPLAVVQPFIHFTDLAHRTIEKPMKCIRGGTLKEFYDEAMKGPKGKILIILDLPMGAMDPPISCQFS